VISGRLAKPWEEVSERTGMAEIIRGGEASGGGTGLGDSGNEGGKTWAGRRAYVEFAHEEKQHELP
jgi:hypothetical protein